MGGFETLVENLVKYHDAVSLSDSITVYCSGKSYPSGGSTYLSAQLQYVTLNANGAQSIPYDSSISGAWKHICIELGMDLCFIYESDTLHR